MTDEQIEKAESQIEQIAQVCHEANRAYCQTLGDMSQPPWDVAPPWQVDSAIAGVAFHIANPEAGASASHESWSEQKLSDGWVWGEEKDPKKKTHPCLVYFHVLPVEQQMKDYIFRGIVHAMRDGFGQ